MEEPQMCISKLKKPIQNGFILYDSKYDILEKAKYGAWEKGGMNR